jgi:hypothetical protein
MDEGFGSVRVIDQPVCSIIPLKLAELVLELPGERVV